MYLRELLNDVEPFQEICIKDLANNILWFSQNDKVRFVNSNIRYDMRIKSIYSDENHRLIIKVYEN